MMLVLQSIAENIVWIDSRDSKLKIEKRVIPQ